MTNFATLKRRILKLAPGWVNLAVAKQKAGLTMISTVADAEKVLKVLTKPRKVTPPVPPIVKQRYNEAHLIWFKQKYKPAYDAGHYVKPDMPKIFTAKGLTRFCINFIEWHGYRAHGIDPSGRKINGKWIPGRTRSGASDISSTIAGKPVMLEIKSGKDRPSEKQIKEQERERRAGGIYEFVYSAEGFLNIFDSIVYG